MLPIVCRGQGEVIYGGRLSRLIRPASPLRSFPAKLGAVLRRTCCAPTSWKGMESNPRAPSQLWVPCQPSYPAASLPCVRAWGIPRCTPALTHSCPLLNANMGYSWAPSHCVTCFSPCSPASMGWGARASAQPTPGCFKLQPGFLPNLNSSRLLAAFPIS